LADPGQNNWLSLKISESPRPNNGLKKALVFISIPKKVIRLATRRNRLRRLIREGLRRGGFITGKNKVYSIRVASDPPKTIGFESVKATLKELFQ